MVTSLSEEELDALSAIMEGGDASSADKVGVTIKFLANATGINENRLKPMLNSLVKDGYVEHRFFSDDTDDYVLREKGTEVLSSL